MGHGSTDETTTSSSALASCATGSNAMASTDDGSFAASGAGRSIWLTGDTTATTSALYALCGSR